MSHQTTPSGRTGKLNVPAIVMLVISVAAPLAVVLGTLPLGLALGGPSLVVMFLAAGVILGLFAVGYAAMSHRITEPGGFFPYISAAMGRVAGSAGAWLAILTYGAFLLGSLAIAGYFGGQILEQETGAAVPWQLYAALSFVVAVVLASMNVEVGALVVTVAVAAEFVLIGALDVFILVRDGNEGLPVEVFSPHVGFGPGFAIALMYAVLCYSGFESAALYAPEAKDPKRTIAVATYATVAILTLFFGFSTWVIIGAIGVDEVQQAALDSGGNIMFALMGQYAPGWMGHAISWMMLFSQFAAVLALTNALARYVQALGEKGLLPGWLGHRAVRTGAPSRAVWASAAVTALVLVVLALLQLDPLLDISSVLFGVGALAMVLLQAAAAAASVLYFRSRQGWHWWRTCVAPGLGAVGLITAFVLMTKEFDLISGKSSTFVSLLPLLTVVAIAGGALYALRVRRRDPEKYAALEFDRDRVEEVHEPLGAVPDRV